MIVDLDDGMGFRTGAFEIWRDGQLISRSWGPMWEDLKEEFEGRDENGNPVLKESYYFKTRPDGSKEKVVTFKKEP